MNHDDLIRAMQIAIAPCVLFSGIGLLVLSLTQRFSRPVDRWRSLLAAMENQHKRVPHIEGQIVIFRRRAYILRAAIGSAVFSMLMLAVLMLLLFVTVMVRLQAAPLLAGLFILSLMGLISALGLFLYDFKITLDSLDKIDHSIKR